VLITAASTGNSDVVRELLTGGAPGISLPELGEMRAAARVAEAAGYTAQSNPAVDLNYADVNARDRWYGRTALMVAAAQGHLEAVRLLVQAGSDLTLTDHEGATAAALARSNGHVDVAALLEQTGAG
jgi:ankyrin repeat protein